MDIQKTYSSKFKKNKRRCRLCLKMTDDHIHFFGEETIPICPPELLQYSVDIAVSTEDGLPQSVCSKCYHFVKKIERFKRICEANELLLRTMLHKSCKIPDGFSKNSEEYLKGEINVQDKSLKAEGKDLQFTYNSESNSFYILELDEVDLSSHGETAQVVQIPLSEDETMIEGPVAPEFQNDSEQKKEAANNCVWSCDLCNKTFSRRTTLTRHYRTHTGEKKYTCSTCQVSFAQSSTLRRHELTHSATYPFSCNFCAKNFIQKVNLKTHMKRHHLDDCSGHRCKLCDKNFMYQSGLSRHLAKHRSFNCSVCEESFKDSISRSNHERFHYNSLL